MAVVIASCLRKEFSGRRPLRRRLLQGRARRQARARGPERRRQDDAPARSRRRGLARGRRARVRRRARGSPSTTSARPTRARARCATTSSRAPPTWPPSSRSCACSRQRWPPATTALRRCAATSEAQARLEHAGGYDWRDRAASVVRGLGFTDDDLDRPLATFSGGELTRASLARALASQPDLLLLDEPTNHLDIESLEWLEQMLKTLDAAVILVAHDRWFLEAVTTAVLEVEGGKSIYFPGAWHVWRREQAARAIHQTKTAARQAEQLERLERFVERFRYKASKATPGAGAASSRSRSSRRSACTRPTARRRTLGFEFLKPARSGRDVLVVESLVAAGGRQAAARRRVVRDRARRARGARRPERLRQDDAARDDCSAAASRRPGRSGSVTASRRRTSHSTRPSSTNAARCSTPRCPAPV